MTGAQPEATADRGFAIYVHWPYCARKCPYCDFNSHAAGEAIDQAGYVDALLVDLEHELNRQSLPAVHSVFIGGGTPSLFAAAVIGRLLEGCYIGWYG